MNQQTEKIALDFSRSEAIGREHISKWGKTLVVAPHPDDESLGCGGAIALLRLAEVEVIVAAISDGTMSHPNSKKFPPEKLRDLREREMIDALKILGVEKESVTFWRLPDRRLPNREDTDFQTAVERAGEYLRENEPQTILIPWRNDPHPDHKAVREIFDSANKSSENRFRILEYPIWLWEMAQNADLPSTENFRIYRLNIADVTETKQRAVRAHASQITDLIEDDPNGFRLSEEVLAHFAVPFEIYFEEII